MRRRGLGVPNPSFSSLLPFSSRSLSPSARFTIFLRKWGESGKIFITESGLHIHGGEGEIFGIEAACACRPQLLPLLPSSLCNIAPVKIEMTRVRSTRLG